MKKTILFLLISIFTATCAWAYFAAFTFQGKTTTAAAVCTPDFSDDFSTDTITAGDWVDDNGTWATSGAGDEEMVNSATSTQSFVRYTTSVTDIEAYAKVTLVDITSGSNAGIFVRATGSTGYRYVIKYKESTNYLQWDVYNGTTWVSLVGEVAVTLTGGDEVAFIIDGIGNDTVVQLWVNPTNDCPYNDTNWDNSSDPADYTITDNPSVSCDTGLVLGLFDYHTTGSIGFDDFTAGSFPGEPPVGTGETHYVVQNGAGLQTGVDLSNAFSLVNFNSSAKWSTLQSDDNLIGPGDVVYFSGNFTTSIIPAGSGTAANPIVLDGYAAGDTTPLDGEDTAAALIETIGASPTYTNTGSYGTAYYGIKIINQDYITIQDFRIKHCDTGIYIRGEANGAGTGDDETADGITIQRNYFNELYSNAINVNLDYSDGYVFSTGATKVIIDENQIYNCGYTTDYNVRDPSGLINVFYSDDLVISNNEIHCDGVSGTYASNLIEIHESTDTLIEYNYLHEPKYETCLSLKENGPQRVIVRFNRMEKGGANAAIFNIGGAERGDNAEYVYAYGNLVAENVNRHGTGVKGGAQYIYVWSNIYRDNPWGGIRIFGNFGTGNPGETYVVGNTFQGNSATADDWEYADIAFWGGNTDTTSVFANNISADSRIGATTGGEYGFYVANGEEGDISALEHNLFYSSTGGTFYPYRYAAGYRELSTMRTSYSREDAAPDGQEDNPDFTNVSTNDLTLTAVSPAINGAASISDAVLPDYAGRITINGETYCNNDGGTCDELLSFKIALDPDTDWTGQPSAAKILTLDRSVVGWDCGAYAYE